MNVDHNLDVDKNLLPRLSILTEKLEDYIELLENPPPKPEPTWNKTSPNNHLPIISAISTYILYLRTKI